MCLVPESNTVFLYPDLDACAGKGQAPAQVQLESFKVFLKLSKDFTLKEIGIPNMI